MGYLSSVIETFPYHILSFIACFGMIAIIVLGVFDKLKLKLISFGIVVIGIVMYVIYQGGLVNSDFEIVVSLKEYNLQGESYISTFSGTAKGDVKLIPFEDSYNIKLMGKKKGKYTFKLIDKNENEYEFEYYFNKDENTVIMNKTN